MSLLSSNILHGERVRHTALTRDDLPAFSAWYDDAGFSRLLDAVPAAPRSQKQWQKWLEKSEEAKDSFTFAIRPTGMDTLIGYLEIDGILWNQQSGWISIGLGDRDKWGQGYGFEAMQLGLRFAFHELNLHRVQLSVFSYNERDISLYRKLGFTQEGVFREHVQRDGQRFDMILYGLLRREWEDSHQ